MSKFKWQKEMCMYLLLLGARQLDGTKKFVYGHSVFEISTEEIAIEFAVPEEKQNLIEELKNDEEFKKFYKTNEKNKKILIFSLEGLVKILAILYYQDDKKWYEFELITRKKLALLGFEGYLLNAPWHGKCKFDSEDKMVKAIIPFDKKDFNVDDFIKENNFGLKYETDENQIYFIFEWSSNNYPQKIYKTKNFKSSEGCTEEYEIEISSRDTKEYQYLYHYFNLNYEDVLCFTEWIKYETKHDSKKIKIISKYNFDGDQKWHTSKTFESGGRERSLTTADETMFENIIDKLVE
jgi:hypothetical protein